MLVWDAYASLAEHMPIQNRTIAARCEHGNCAGKSGSGLFSTGGLSVA